MSTLRNKVQLVGNLGTKPQLRTTETGKSVARMSLATHENYKNAKGEWIRQTLWHNLVAWGKTAEIMAERLQKGNEVMIEGKLTHREYTDRTGIKRQLTEIQVTELLVIEKK